MPATALPVMEIVVRLVSAYVSQNALRPSDVPKLIGDVHEAMESLGKEPDPVKVSEAARPAVPIRRSVTPDYIICLDDGKKFKSLKRHLLALGMTPAQYRQKWGLPADYPMVAPNYAASRSEIAKAFGLGRR